MSPFNPGRLTRGDWLALALLAAWPLFNYLPVAVGQSVWFTTDVIRLFHPFAVELARALSEGRLPLWTPGILSGFPLLAEGQVGALYPVNWVLLKLLPAHFALSYAILIHLIWAGWGMYLLVRDHGMNTAAGILSGLVFSSSGFVFGHLSHASVIATMSWLPWMVLFQRRWHYTRTPLNLFLTTLACAMQFLTGSAQIAFLNTIPYLFFGVLVELECLKERAQVRKRVVSFLIACILPLVIGIGIAAIQLVPTAELVRYSVRQDASAEFATSYSLAPTWLAQFISAFWQGEPAETNGEYWAYISTAALLLALSALLLHRERTTYLLALFTAAMCVLALGGSTPIYPSLLGLPIVGMFRVPARFMHPAIFTAAILAAMGLDALMKRMLAHNTRVQVALIVITAVFGILVLVKVLSPEIWLPAWRWIPLAIVLALALLMVRGVGQRLSSSSLGLMVLGLVAVDFAMYAQPFLSTIDALTPASYVAGVPRSLGALGDPSGRVYTDLSMFPSVPALRASLFPNSNLAFGWSSAQAYSSLALAGQDAFSFDPSPTMLNLMNAKYLLIPLEPRPENKKSTPKGSLGLDVVDNEMIIPPTAAMQIRVASYTENADQLHKGTVVARLQVRFANSAMSEFPIRAGIETEDWDIERKNDGSTIAASGPLIAHDLAGFWRSFGRQFVGHTYEAVFNLSSAVPVVGIDIKTENPAARLGIESVQLADQSGSTLSLAKVGAKNEFQLRFMSDTVAIWENLSVLPRAFLVHDAIAADDATAAEMLRDPAFDPINTVIFDKKQPVNSISGQSTNTESIRVVDSRSDRVEIEVQGELPGYLVLCDSWYPGWAATVDGELTPIERADLVFRAVPISSGRHRVVFEYRPASFLLGGVISAASLALAMLIALWLKLKTCSQLPVDAGHLS